MAEVAQNFSAMCTLEFNADRVLQQSTFATVGESFTAVGSSDLDNTNYTTVIDLSKHGKDKTLSMTMIQILAAQLLCVDNIHRLDDVCCN